MNNNRLSFPNGFEKTDVRWEKIKIKLAPNSRAGAVISHNQHLIALALC
jgi:hypothetical protein